MDIQIITKMANRSTAAGQDLALGAAKRADKCVTPDKASHLKGLDMPAYDPIF
jgi:aldehyde:ferredoxin oxidoreductase